MLRRLEIANYRGFRSYSMDGLTQVNLLVGKNNSGKTAVAEAIHFLTSGGDPAVLSETAGRRGEVTANDEGRTFPELRHFFYGHEITPESFFSLRSDNGHPALTVRLISLAEQTSLFSEGSTEGEDFDARATFGVVIEGAVGFGAGNRDLALTERGALIFNPRLRSRPLPVGDQTKPTFFVPTDSVVSRRLTTLWRQAVLDSSQQEVIDAMALIDESIQQILFLPADGMTRSLPSSRDWYVQSKEFSKPVPLGSFGDGMRRLMTLALALTKVIGGTLLIDEIDTGLHYSVMADMWKLVIKKAIAADVQVFATTHSWDCIEGLSRYCQSDPSAISNVAIHKIDRTIPHSVPFAGDAIIRMAKADIDPR